MQTNNNTTSNVTDFFNGYQKAFQLSFATKNEKIIRAGHNIILSGQFQFTAVFQACAFMFPLLQARGLKKRVIIPLCGASLIGTLLLSYAVHNKTKENKTALDPEKIKESLQKISSDDTEKPNEVSEQKWQDKLLFALYNNVTNVAQVAVLVSSVASIFFLKEKRFIGIAGIVGTLNNYGVHTLAEHNVISHEARTNLLLGSLYFSWALSLVFGHVVLKIAAAIQIAAEVADHHLKKKRLEEEKAYYDALQAKKVEQVPLHEFDTYQLLEKSGGANTSLNEMQIHKSHLYSHTQIPEAPEDAELDDLLTLFDEVNWNAEDIYPTVAALMAEDKEWIAKQDASTVNSYPAYIAFLRKNLEDYVHYIKDKEIKYGEPQDYQMLANMAKWISHYLKKKDEDYLQKTAVILIPLAQSAHYCGAGVFEPTLTAYLSTTSSSPSANLQSKILAHLSSRREQGFYDLIRELLKHVSNPDNPMTQVKFDKYIHSVVWDRHFFGMYAKLFGSKFGLPTHVMTDNDPLLRNIEIAQYIYKKLLGPVLNIIENMFWQTYNPTTLIMDNIKEPIGDVSLDIKISLEEVQTWYREYFQRELLKEKHEGKAWDDLTAGQKSTLQSSINTRILDTFNFGALKNAPAYLWTTMLREMGVLEKKPVMA